MAVLTVLVAAGHAALPLASLHWVLENAAEFRLHLLLLDGAFLFSWVVVAIAGRVPWKRALPFLGVAVASFLFCFLALAPLWLAWPPEAGEGVSKLKVMSANVHTPNRDVDHLLALVEKERPHVLFLFEVDAWWRGALSSLNESYPVRVQADLDRGNFGIAAFCRVPGARGEARELGSGGVSTPATAHLVFSWEGRTLEAIGVHTLPPVSSSGARSNRLQLRALAERVASSRRPVILAGDFNRTPWSPAFRALLRAGALSHGRPGRGYLSTWPRGSFLFRLPIDHVLATGAFSILDFRRLPAGGSDHNPVAATLGFAPKKPRQ